MQKVEPLYMQMRAYLLELVERNRGIPNYRLPSENQLAQKFNASRISAKHAFDTLAEEGVIYRQRGRGSYIMDKAPEEKPQQTWSMSDTEDSIALIVPFTSTIFMSEIIEGIQEELKKRGLHFIIFLTDNAKEREVKYLRMAQERFRGILLFPGAYATYHEETLRLVLNRFPMVQIDRYLPGLDLSYVAGDHFGATYRATQFLFEKGHQRVGFVGHLISHASSVADRVRGYDQATLEHDARYSSLLKLNVEDSLCDFEERFRNYLATAKPTAIISPSHLHAPTIMRVLREKGMMNDVELMLYDNEFVIAKEFMGYHPYIIDQQPREIGRKAARLLCDLAFDGAKPTSIKVKEQIYRL